MERSVSDDKKKRFYKFLSSVGKKEIDVREGTGGSLGASGLSCQNFCIKGRVQRVSAAHRLFWNFLRGAWNIGFFSGF